VSGADCQRPNTGDREDPAESTNRETTRPGHLRTELPRDRNGPKPEGATRPGYRKAGPEGATDRVDARPGRPRPKVARNRVAATPGRHGDGTGPGMAQDGTAPDRGWQDGAGSKPDTSRRKPSRNQQQEAPTQKPRRPAEGAKGRRGEGAKGRRGEGAKGRRGEGAKGRRGEGAPKPAKHRAQAKRKA